MFFRIHFEPKGSFWCIQFQRFYIYWETAMTIDAELDKPTVMKFKNYNEAMDYVKDQGIDRVYTQVNRIEVQDNNQQLGVSDLLTLLNNAGAVKA